MNYTPATKSGRAWNGSHRDGGKSVHAVENFTYPSWDKALCGTRPGSNGGNGWIDEPNKQVSCPKCLKKINQENGKASNVGGV